MKDDVWIIFSAVLSRRCEMAVSVVIIVFVDMDLEVMEKFNPLNKIFFLV